MNAKQQFIETIKNQLRDHEPASTADVYEYLLQQGYEEAQAIEKLAFYLETYTYEILANQEEFDDMNWSRKIQEIKKESLQDALVINAYQLKRMAGRIRKSYGYIKSGQEEAYSQGIFYLENNLYVLYKRYDINTKDMRTILAIAMYLASGYLEDVVYDFREAASIDQIELGRMMNQNFNPFANEDLYDDLERNSDLNLQDPDIQKSILTNTLRCLVFVTESIDRYEKQRGSSAYIRYLENKFQN